MSKLSIHELQMNAKLVLGKVQQVYIQGGETVRNLTSKEGETGLE